MATDVPAWFHNAVIDGLSALQTLALRGAPPAETVTLTAEVWIAALWAAGGWRGDADVLRLQAAFVAVAGKVDWWPAPRAVLDCLPPVPAAPAITAEAPPPSHDRIAQVRGFANALRRQMLIRPAPTRNRFTGTGVDESPTDTPRDVSGCILAADREK